MKRIRFSLALLFLLLVVIPETRAQPEETATGPTNGTISGQVVNENGQPIPSAFVFVRGSAPQFQPRNTTTDNEGRFQVSGLEPLLYVVSASAPSYIAPQREQDAGPSLHRIGDSVTISLVKGGVISGTVLTSTGEPVVQVGVKAVMIKDANGLAPRQNPYQFQRTTDDRGMYRLYSLTPGTYLVTAGGTHVFRGYASAFDGDAPTYSPSSTRDTAAEIIVRAGEEITGVDIRYRGEPGRTISGFVNSPLEQNPNAGTSISLVDVSNGLSLPSAFTFQPPGLKGFSFQGVADGEYEVIAQATPAPGQAYSSEPRHISVKGADVTGIEISLRPLGSIAGHVVLEPSTAPECEKKRQPLFSETLVMVRLNEQSIPKGQFRPFAFYVAQGSPNPKGDFLLRNLVPGQYDLNTRFYARYWYLRSVTVDTGAAPAAGRTAVTKKSDIARNGVSLKFGEQLKDLTIRLALGAGSLRGKIMKDAGAMPSKLFVHLVPAEKENAEDVLRYFVDEVNSEGNFGLNNLPPGRYFVFTRAASPNDATLGAKSTEFLAQLRRTAEASKTEVEFKPCQNITNFQLPLSK